MIIAETPVLWAFESDVLSRGWLDWLAAHTTFSKPLHRYEGQLSIMRDRLILDGVDKRSGNEVTLEIFKYQVEQLYLGFDESYHALETRGLGLMWKPLRMTFTIEGRQEKVYFITNYGKIRTGNRDYFELLKDWLS